MLLIEVGCPEVQDDIHPKADDRKVVEPVHQVVIIVGIIEAHDNGEEHWVDDNEEHHEEVPGYFEHPLTADDEEGILDFEAV